MLFYDDGCMATALHTGMINSMSHDACRWSFITDRFSPRHALSGFCGKQKVL